MLKTWNKIQVPSAAVAVPLGVSLILGVRADIHAQEAAQRAPVAQAAAATLEEIVVTARFRSESLQQTPIALTAITADDIERRVLTQSSDVAYLIPNASFRPAHAAFGPSMTAYMRGVGQSDFNFAFEPGVAIYVDDVYYPTIMSSQFDLMDLERVEALRGPQGTLFGRGAIGGAIRYISKQPKGDDSGFAQVTLGDFHRVDLRAGFDVSLIPETLFMRITGVSKRSDGYQKLIDFACAFPSQAGTLPALTHNANCQWGTLGGTDVQGARANFRLVASDALEFGFSADYQRDTSESRADTITTIAPLTPFAAAWNQFMVNGTLPNPMGGPAIRPNPNFFGYGVPFDSRFISKDPYVSYASFQDPYSGLKFPNQNHLDQRGVAATMDWKMTDAVAAKLILAWRNWSSAFGGDPDGTPLGFDGSDGAEQFTYRTAELRFSGETFNKLLDWTAGAFYYNGSPGSDNHQQALNASIASLAYYVDPSGYTGGLPNALQVNGTDNGQFKNVSGFAHAVFNVTEKLHFTGGIRYSSDKKTSSTNITGVVQSVDSDQNSFDWLAGVDYRFTPNVMAYVSASTGYRPPAFNPRPFQPSQFVPVDGEKLTAYELGAKSDFFDHRLRVNIAGFYSDYSKRILMAPGIECVKSPTPPYPCVGPVAVPVIGYVNAPAKIYGAELEVEVRPLEALLIALSGGNTHFDAESAMFQGFPYNGTGPNGEAYNVPKYNASGSVQYSFDLPNGATFTPRWDSYLQAEICSGQLQTSCAPGYTVSNLHLEYANEGREWTVTAGIENVTDKRYYYNVFDLTPYGEPTVEAQIAPPRTWSLQLVRTFGARK